MISVQSISNVYMLKGNDRLKWVTRQKCQHDSHIFLGFIGDKKALYNE